MVFSNLTTLRITEYFLDALYMELFFTTLYKTIPAPTSGFAYSLEALSEDEDADDEDAEDGERSTITQEQLAAALQVTGDTSS